MGTLEPAAWSMGRPAYAFGWLWRVHVGAPAGCGYCGSWDPPAPHGLTHNGYTGPTMDRTGVSSGANLTLDEPGLVCSTIIPPQQHQPQNTVVPGSIRVCVPRPPLAQIWRAVRRFGAWASKVGHPRHNMGTLEAAAWSMGRPAYAFGWVWRVRSNCNAQA